jgi:hypothetical protein
MRSAVLYTTLVVIAAALAAGRLAAQDTVVSTTLVRRQVRAIAPPVSSRELVGTVIQADGTRLIMVGRLFGDTLQVPLQSIERLRIRAGGGGAVETGLLGAIVGGVLGGAVLYVWANASHQEAETSEVLAIGIPYGAFIGGITGAVIGARRWRNVHIQP